MRFALVTVALAAVSASASTLFRRQDLPTCAATCLANAPLGECTATDDVCLCKNQAFVTSAAGCIETTCTGSDLATAISAAQQLCASVGVTLSNLPTGSATTAAATTAAATTTSSKASGSSPATSSAPATAATATKPVSSASASTKAASTSTSSSAPAASSSKSAGSIVGVNAFAGMAAFGLAALAL